MSNYLSLYLIFKDMLLPRFQFRSLLALDIAHTSGCYTNNIAVVEISCDTNVTALVSKSKCF